MTEFSIINKYFKDIAPARSDVLFGIGDDAACVQIPSDHQLLVSTDTLISGTHFSSNWDAYNIAWKAVMVNISDIAAMGGHPAWISLALTLPVPDEIWLSRFSQGLKDAVQKYNITLIGGDTTKGSLSITITIHGLVPNNKAVRRSGARPGDTIWLSGEIGAAAQAYRDENPMSRRDKRAVMQKLQYPTPRVDLSALLSSHASAAIDVSDGLCADLTHICAASNVGAYLITNQIPVHSLVKKYQPQHYVQYALTGGDDYELCFTIPETKLKSFYQQLQKNQVVCYPIGSIIGKKGLFEQTDNGNLVSLNPKGYQHFTKDES